MDFLTDATCAILANEIQNKPLITLNKEFRAIFHEMVENQSSLFSKIVLPFKVGPDHCPYKSIHLKDDPVEAGPCMISRRNGIKTVHQIPRNLAGNYVFHEDDFSHPSETRDELKQHLEYLARITVQKCVEEAYRSLLDLESLPILRESTLNLSHLKDWKIAIIPKGFPLPNIPGLVVFEAPYFTPRKCIVLLGNGHGNVYISPQTITAGFDAIHQTYFLEYRPWLLSLIDPDKVRIIDVNESKF